MIQTLLWKPVFRLQMTPHAPSIEYGHYPHANHLSLIIFMFVKLPLKKPIVTKQKKKTLMKR
jgi:hypothetical protein